MDSGLITLMVMLAFALAVTAASWLLATVVAMGRVTPNFSHRSMAISELGVYGSPNQAFMGYGVFVPAGLGAMAVAPVLLLAGDGAVHVGTAALAASIGFAYAGCGLLPCNAPGERANLRHSLHMLTAAVEYIGGPLALMHLSRSLDAAWPAVAGTIALLAAASCTVARWRPWMGALQRTADITLWGALLVLIGHLE